MKVNPTKRHKKRERSIITTVYSCLSVPHTSVSDLAKALNQLNAEAINKFEEEWEPVGSPVKEGRFGPGLDLLIRRKGNLSLDMDN